MGLCESKDTYQEVHFWIALTDNWPILQSDDAHHHHHCNRPCGRHVLYCMYCTIMFCDWACDWIGLYTLAIECNRGHMRKWRIEYVPLRMASSGAIALWCQTVMSRVHGNTINTMARMSLLFGISRIGFMSRHYLPGERRSDKHVNKGR